MLFCCLWVFFNFSKKSFRNTISLSVEQFRSRSSPTFWSKLFAKVIKKRQKSPLVGKELRHFCQEKKNTDIFHTSAWKQFSWLYQHVSYCKNKNRVYLTCSYEGKLKSIRGTLGNKEYKRMNIRISDLLRLFIWQRCSLQGYIKMPRPLLIFSQSDYLIWIVAVSSHT